MQDPLGEEVRGLPPGEAFKGGPTLPATLQIDL